MEFSTAFEKLMKDEGLWVLTHDPNDPGGETWSGISRIAYPDWDGWPLIDEAKTSPSALDRTHKNYSEIKKLTRQFYETQFWLSLACDKLPDGLAYELFEQAVNLGKRRATAHLQRTLNCLNRPVGNALEYGEDLAEDGIFGPATLSRLLTLVSRCRAEAIMHGINGLQCAYYIQLGEDVRRRMYTNGWLAKRGKGSLV